MAKAKWSRGDVFSVSLSSGTKLVGQVVSRQTDFMGSVLCVFTDFEFEDLNDCDRAIEISDLLTVQFVTPEALNTGVWNVIGHASLPDIEKYVNFPEYEDRGFIGIEVLNSVVINCFLEAVFCLRPWDMMHDPEYFEKMLISPDKKPKEPIFSKMV